MPSSTSSSRQELKVVLCVAASLLVVELASRAFGSRISKEIRYIRTFPRKADSLRKSKSRRILILGNSLTNCGLDLPLLKSQLPRHSRDRFHIETIAMDGTAITEWYHIFRRFFAEPKQLPNVVIVNFHPAGKDAGIADEKLVRMERLVHYFRARDIPQVALNEVEGFGNRCRFVQSYLLASFGNRARFKRMALGALGTVPHYARGERHMHRLAASRRKGGRAKPPVPTYRMLGKLAGLTHRCDVQLILVAMPVSEYVPTGPALTRLVHAEGLSLLDCQRPPGLTAEGYADSSHLNEQGEQIFTRYYAERIAKELTRESSPSEALEPGAGR